MVKKYCSEETRKYVEEIISKNKVVYVSILGNIPCRKLKNELEKNSVDYAEIDVSGPEKEELFICIFEKSRNRYVPQVIHHGKFVGNYFDSMDYINKGKLRDSYKRFL